MECSTPGVLNRKETNNRYYENQFSRALKSEAQSHVVARELSCELPTCTSCHSRATAQSTRNLQRSVTCPKRQTSSLHGAQIKANNSNNQQEDKLVPSPNLMQSSKASCVSGSAAKVPFHSLQQREDKTCLKKARCIAQVQLLMNT